jgi:branched-subunit amino acid aminotransferase/4-amino-4-deoxychorismate lyase
MASTSSDGDFHIITALRYDPLLLTSEENSQAELNFVSPSPFYILRYHRDRLSEAAQHFDIPGVDKILQDGKALHELLLKKVNDFKETGGQDEALKVRVLFDRTGKMTVDMIPVPPVSLETLFPKSFDPPNAKSPPHPAMGSSKPFKPSPLTGGALNLGPTDSLPSKSASVSLPEWRVKLDTAQTPSSPVTLLKTTVRDLYNTSCSRALPSHPANPKFSEVMLYNECDELTEGSRTSLYVLRGGRWVTPPVGVPVGSFDATTLKDGDRWDEGEFRKPFAGRWGHSVRSAKVGAGGQRGTTRRWALKNSLCMEEPVSIDTVQVGEGVWVSNGVGGFGFGRVVD